MEDATWMLGRWTPLKIFPDQTLLIGSVLKTKWIHGDFQWSIFFMWMQFSIAEALTRGRIR